MGVVNRFAAWLMGLVVILLPFFVILSAVSVFCTEQFVRYEYSLPSFPPSQRFSAQDRYYNSVQTVRYVRGAISVTERAAYIGRVRALAHQCAKGYLESREALGYPLLPARDRKKLLKSA